MIESGLTEILCNGLDALDLSLPPIQQQQLVDYCLLLHKWNRTYNLTAIRDPQQMVIRHVLDSLVLLPYLDQDHWLDVGSGAGIPSIPLAIVRPEWQWDSIDSNGKKTRFQIQAKASLGLKNFQVHQCRIEALSLQRPVQRIISRAFSELADFVHLTAHLETPQTRWFAMKGQFPQTELAALPTEFDCIAHHSLQVPQLNEERHLIILGRSTGKG